MFPIFNLYYRLLVQLEETERRFSDFQSTHAQRVRQHLEHRLFLQDVVILQEKFQDHLAVVSGMVEIGDTADRVESLVQETNCFHKLAMVRHQRL